MEIRQYIALIRRWLWLIILGGAIAATAAFLISWFQTPIYQSTSVLLISEGLIAGSGNEFQSLQLSEQLAQSYLERLTNYEVLTQAIANLDLNMTADDLQKVTQARLINNSHLIALSVEHPNPRTAAALANEIPQVFAERNMTLQLARYADSKENLQTELTKINAELEEAEAALAHEQGNGNEPLTIEQLTDNILRLRETHARLLQSYEDVRVAEASSLNNLVIDEPARVPSAPIRPRIVTNTLLAGIVGVMLALGVVFLIDYLDDTIKDPDVLEQATGLSTIGLIANYPSSNGNDKLIMAAQPRSPSAEAYRQVRTNVQFVGVSRHLSTILVTSPNAAEGKTTTAANLAIALAQADYKVILVDSDMRRPALHSRFGLLNKMGLTNLLLSNEYSGRFLRETGIPNLYLLTSGPLPPNPAELIHSERMKQVLDWLQEQADFVILDSPPVLAVTDGVLLSQLASTTLMVIEAGKTSYQALALAIRQIEAVEGHVAGLLINKANPRRSGYYYNYYYQSSYAYQENGKGA